MKKSIYFVIFLFIRLCIIVIVLLSIEGGLRFFGYNVLEDKSLNVVSNNQRLIYENRANYDGYYADAPVHINSLGLRCHDISLKKREGVLRILVLGDSFTFGYGISDDETFSAQLEKILNQRNLGVRFEVLNAGVNGYNTEQEVEYFRTNGITFSPDLVILTFYINDLGNEPHFIVKNGKLGYKGVIPLRSRIKEFLRNNSVIYPLLTKSFHILKYKLGFGLDRSGLLHISQYYKKLSEMDPEGWKKNKDSLEKLYQLASKKNVIPIFTIFPDLVQFDNYPFKNAHNEFMSFCTSKNYHCIDLFEAFKGKEAPKLWVSPQNRHANKEGNNIVARLLADYISSLLYKNSVLN